MKILIVDDTDFHRLLLCCYLKNYHCEFIHAQNGKEALELMSQNDPDIILTDLYMPVMITKSVYL